MVPALPGHSSCGDNYVFPMFNLTGAIGIKSVPTGKGQSEIPAFDYFAYNKLLRQISAVLGDRDCGRWHDAIITSHCFRRGGIQHLIYMDRWTMQDALMWGGWGESTDKVAR